MTKSTRKVIEDLANGEDASQGLPRPYHGMDGGRLRDAAGRDPPEEAVGFELDPGWAE